MTSLENASVPLVITLFGPIHVLVDGQPLPRLRSRKTLWLLALLCLRASRPVEREWICGMFWPDLDSSQGFANLRPILSELRSALGKQKERLQSPDRHTLRLDLTGASVDLIAFDAAIKSAELADLEQAVALYQGPLLEGCHEEWVPQERAAREQSCLLALLKLGESALSAGNLETAVDFYQQAATLDPWSDSARRGWMEALAQMGDSNAALQVYRKYVAVLRDDPKAAPDRETTLLYQRLRAEAQQQVAAPSAAVTKPAPLPTVTGYLPHPLTDLVGREDEQIAVADRLRRSRLVTLVGSGGIGKTRLAIATASEIVRMFTDGVWLVALEALSADKQVAQQIASVLGLQENPRQSPLQNVTDHLRRKRLLLVLDNCEHLLPSSALAAEQLLRECPNVHILATSREALGITGEAVWTVPALTTPDPAHLPAPSSTLVRVLMGYESVQLFVERAQSIQKTFVLTRENASGVAYIVSRLEGIPLAIELAAARIRALSVDQIASRLDDHLTLLTGGSRTAMSRQQTLRATLDWSHAQLSPQEQILLRRLSVFTGGWTLSAAEAVCTGQGIQASEVLDLLTALVSKSLVLFEQRQPTQEGRYRLLEVVRQYAAERLHSGENLREIETRHRDWYVALAELAEPELRGRNQKVWIARLTADYGNYRMAMSRCSSDTTGIKAGLRLTTALFPFWNGRYAYQEGRERLQEALDRDESQSPTRERGNALLARGRILERQGENLSARADLEEALRILQPMGEKKSLASALHALGGIASTLGDLASGQRFIDQGMAIRQEIGDQNGIAHSLSALAWLAMKTSEYGKAKLLFEESLEICRELGDEDRIAFSLRYLGVIAQTSGDYALAERHLQEAKHIFTELGNRRELAFTHYALAGLAENRSLYDTAQAHGEESLSILNELGDRNGIAMLSGSLGLFAIHQGDPTTAHTYLTEGLQIYQDIGDKAGAANCLHGLGILAHQKGDFTSANAALNESLQTLYQLADTRAVVILLEERAGLLVDQGKTEAAVPLMGVSECLRAQRNLSTSPSVQAKREALLARIHLTLNSNKFAALWEQGCAMTLDQAVASALATSR